MIEYRLEKKVLGGWQTVSWWSDDEFDKAKGSYDSCKKNVGYAWRLVKLEVLEEVRLEEEIEIKQSEPETLNSWGTPVRPKHNGWLDTPAKTVDVSTKEHGLTGSVWVINHSTKDKKRVPYAEVEKLLAEGYERGGPRTAFREG